MKDLQILWSACKYYWQRFTNLFKERKFLNDGHGHYYYEGDYQHVLYRRAYQSWQNKRYDRGQCNIGTDLFEQDTNISDNIKK